MKVLDTSLTCGSVIGLPKRHVLALAARRGTRVESRRGALWVTQDGDLRDVVLTPGQSHVIEHDGPVLLQALDAALVSLHVPAPPIEARPGWWQRVRQTLGPHAVRPFSA
jgi:hypothetical protein